MRSAAAAGLLFVAMPIAAAAQSGGAAPVGQGPMTVERVPSGFLVAPDFKITEVDRKTSALAGGYAGWLTDDTFFIGGGGYWLANRASDRQMAYGGLVVQWLARRNEAFGFGAKALVGGGQATMVSDGNDIHIQDLDRDRFPTTRFRFHEGFFVAEPEVNLLVRLTKHVTLTGGAGYRFIGAEGRDGSRLSAARTFALSSGVLSFLSAPVPP